MGPQDSLITPSISHRANQLQIYLFAEELAFLIISDVQKIPLFLLCEAAWKILNQSIKMRFQGETHFISWTHDPFLGVYSPLLAATSPELTTKKLHHI